MSGPGGGDDALERVRAGAIAVEEAGDALGGARSREIADADAGDALERVRARAIAVEEAGDPRIADYVDLRERDLAGRGGAFVAEGEVVVRVLIERSRLAVRSVLVSEKRLAAAAALLARLDGAAKIYVVNQSLMDGVVGFPIHRGLLAIGERGPARDPGALLDAVLGDGARAGAETRAGAAAGARAGEETRSGEARVRTVIGLVGVTNHDNVGGIFRNAAAFGADAVLLDGATCDPLYRKAIRVSVGGALVVPFARCASGEEMIELLAAREVEAIALSPRGAERIEVMGAGRRRALLLGAEGAGLPEAILARTRTARIAMAPGFDSLNVAVACGIALHALAPGDG